MDASQFALFDKVEQGIFVLRPDSDGTPRYFSMNRFALNRLGRPIEDIVGKTAQELYPGRMGEIAFARHRQAVASKQSATYRLKIPASDSIMSLLTTLNPITDDAGEVTYIVGTSIDVTSNEMVGELQTHAATLSSEIEDFVSLAAHDLRTPIMNVGMLANLLREDFEDHGDGKLELIDALEDLSTTALSLISDVLSHAQATSTRADITCFDFAAMVHEIISMLDPMKRCQHTVTQGHVTGDRAATQIILRNLIDNALKHALDDVETQALCLDIRLAPLKDRDGFFSVSVHDNGHGISEEGVRYLNSGELKTDSGFGLVGVRRLLKARGGTISAENASDGGAVVSFTLPGVLDAPGLISAVPLHPSLKLSPDLLDHKLEEACSREDGHDEQDSYIPLRTTSGESMKLDNTQGLSVRLTPGALPMHSERPVANGIIGNLLEVLKSTDFDMNANNYWSDTEGSHPEGRGAYLAREWSRAASVLHVLASDRQKSVGSVCGFNRIIPIQADTDLLIIKGMDHLLPKTAVAPEHEETKTACFMGLLSQLAAKPEVLLVTPLHKAELLNAVGSAIVQSATPSSTPFKGTGLNGSGEVIQVRNGNSGYFLDTNKRAFSTSVIREGYGFRYRDVHYASVAGLPVVLALYVSF